MEAGDGQRTEPVVNDSRVQVEGVNDYDGDIWHVVLVRELTDDGRIRRDTRCYVQPTNPHSCRSQWVERMET